MKCPHCGGEHPASYKFCPVTGKEIDAHHGMKACDCPDCGKYILPAEARYCPRCGSGIKVNLIVSDDKRKALCKAVDTLLKIKFGNREV